MTEQLEKLVKQHQRLIENMEVRLNLQTAINTNQWLAIFGLGMLCVCIALAVVW